MPLFSSACSGGRYRRPELMDHPDLAADLHVEALGALGRLNRATRAARMLWPAIAAAARRCEPRPVRVLDIASGGGDVVRDWARLARRHGLEIHLAACDKSLVAVRYAQRQATRVAPRRIDCFQLDALRDPLPQDYDVLSCSLFLHHLSTRQAVGLLRKMAAATRHLVLISDLLRTRLGYVMAQLGPRILTRSPVVHTDAVRSVAAAFSRSEVDDLLRASGLVKARVTRCWSQRFVIEWQRPATARDGRGWRPAATQPLAPVACGGAPRRAGTQGRGCGK